MMESNNSGYIRTKEEISETLRLAAIKETELNNVTQALYYAPDDLDHGIKLLELDEHLSQVINIGDSLSFRGEKRESVTLCTKNRTYDIKEAETSNSCLLVPRLKFAKETDEKDANERTIKKCNIKGIFHRYYEVRECRPKLAKLLTVLEPSSFKGLEYESTIDPKSLYNWSRLQNEVQASDDELIEVFPDYSIVNIDGYYRLISFEVEARSVTLMLDFFDENLYELDEVDRELTYETLKELIFQPVFDVLFKKYTDPSEKIKTDGTPLYSYNEEKCCKLLAKVLLAASPVTEYKQFMESWRIGTPEKMTPKEEYLGGISVIVQSGVRKRDVVSFPEIDLPRTIMERFNELFKVKDKWTVEEVTPYIISFTTSKMNVNALLTKHTRCSVINGVKYYSSRYGK